MEALKTALWILFILMLFFTPTSNKTEGEKWRITIEFSSLILCLTLLYVFGK